MPHDMPPVPLPTAPTQSATTTPPGVIETVLLILTYFALQFGFGGAFPGVVEYANRLFPAILPAAPDRLIVVVILTLVSAAAVVMTWIVRRWAAQATDGGPAGLGFTPPEGRYVAIGTALGLLAPILGGLLTQFLAGDHAVSQTVTDIADNAHLGMRVALLPTVVLVGPLVEEVLFRGALLSILRTRLGDGWAIAISATIFGAVHLPDLD